ncbi:MAG: hypothetical protein PHS50_11860, partial [Kiritimatiellae bacterium]|nr:hypothetical protein [Kiritimatiellia bacterium]
SVFRGSNQKLRSAPNRCGEDRDESQCLRGFAQNPYAQLPFLGLVTGGASRAFLVKRGAGSRERGRPRPQQRVSQKADAYTYSFLGFLTGFT